MEKVQLSGCGTLATQCINEGGRLALFPHGAVANIAK